MSITQRALWVIERNLGADQTLETLAEACGTDRFRLAHAFGRRTGRAPMQYLRLRRLSEAARRLAAGQADILALAIESGYGSHEAFTRAFKAAFGATPEAVREAASIDALALVEPLPLDEAATSPRLRHRTDTAAPWHGVAAWNRFDFGDNAPIAHAWERFMSQAWQVDAVAGSIPIGVARVDPAQDGFAYACAIEARPGARVPEGLERLDLPARRCLVVSHDGHVADLPRTYAAVWDGELDADTDALDATAPSIERHRPTFDPRTGLGGVEIWLPLL